MTSRTTERVSGHKQSAIASTAGKGAGNQSDGSRQTRGEGSEKSSVSFHTHARRSKPDRRRLKLEISDPSGDGSGALVHKSHSALHSVHCNVSKTVRPQVTKVTNYEKSKHKNKAKPFFFFLFSFSLIITQSSSFLLFPFHLFLSKKSSSFCFLFFPFPSFVFVFFFFFPFLSLSFCFSVGMIVPNLHPRN